MKRLFLFLVLLVSVDPAWGRDWLADPAVVHLGNPARIAAVGDIHGAFTQFANSLECLGVARRDSENQKTLSWTGGTAVLILTGDYCDRGEETPLVFDTIMALEKQAASEGGRVVALLGNHDAMLLSGHNKKFAEWEAYPHAWWFAATRKSLTAVGKDPEKAFSPGEPYGDWLRRRPLAAVAHRFLFVHAGPPRGFPDLARLSDEYRQAVEGERWRGFFLMNEKSPVWHREWWDDAEFLRKSLATLNVRGVVFGHTVGALSDRGKIGCRDQQLVGIDIGMTPAYGCSQGGGILLEASAAGEISFTAHFPDAPTEELFVLSPSTTRLSPSPRRK